MSDNGKLTEEHLVLAARRIAESKGRELTPEAASTVMRMFKIGCTRSLSDLSLSEAEADMEDLFDFIIDSSSGNGRIGVRKLEEGTDEISNSDNRPSFRWLDIWPITRAFKR